MKKKKAKKVKKNSLKKPNTPTPKPEVLYEDRPRQVLFGMPPPGGWGD